MSDVPVAQTFPGYAQVNLQLRLLSESDDAASIEYQRVVIQGSPEGVALAKAILCRFSGISDRQQIEELRLHDLNYADTIKDLDPTL